MMDAVICGGGPAGLMTAIMLAQKTTTTTTKENYHQQPKAFPNIKVYDRLSAPPNPNDDTVWDEDVARFYLIGLGGRGQTVLQHFGVLDEVKKTAVAVVGRKDWPPDQSDGVERIFTKDDKRVPTLVLPRDKLVGVLYQHIVNKYQGQIELHYGYEVHPIDFAYQEGTSVRFQIAKCTTTTTTTTNDADEIKPALLADDDDVLCDTTDSVVEASTKLLIAADGTVRTFANAMEAADAADRSHAVANSRNPLLAKAWSAITRGKKRHPFRVKRYIDDNQRVYKTIPLKIPKDWRPDLNYSARTKTGRVTFDALPANRNGEYCGVLLLRKDDPLAKADTDPKDLRELLDTALPQFSKLLNDDTVATVARKPVSYLPGFRYAGPRLNQGNSCLLLGDCAHTVKPYFGLGANSALEDVKILSDVMDAHHGDIAKSVHTFSKQRAADSKALVRLSRDLDRPGMLGFFTFILPIILDSVFHGLAPGIFTPNVISMLQREEYTFVQVARRKRLERMAHLAILGGVLSSGMWAVKATIRTAAKMLGRKSSTVTGALAGSIAGAVLLKKLAKFLVPGLAPGDVINRMTEKMQDSKTHLTPLGKLSSSKSEQQPTER